MASDVQYLIEHLDLHDVTLIGWSLGGAVAAVYARLYDLSRLGRMVFVSASARLAEAEGYPGLPAAAFEQVAALVAQDWPAFARAWVAGMFVSDPGEQLRAWLTNIALETPGWLVSLLFKMAPLLDERAFLAKLPLPALIIHGTADNVVPFPFGQALAALIPRAQLEILPDCGHLPFLERRARFNQVLTDFIEGKALSAVEGGSSAGMRLGNE